MNTKEQRQFLEELYEATDVTDVYFHKGTLYVINHYDEESVASFIDGWNIGYHVIVDDDKLRSYG